MTKTGKIAVLAVMVVLVIGGATIALANNGNTYTGCLTPGGTIIHVAIGGQPAHECASSHTQISWNETGLAGADGADGADGVDGVDGVDGADGADGTDGADGADGADGDFSGWEIVTVQFVPNTWAPGEIKQLSAFCPSGKKVLGGGFLAVHPTTRAFASTPNSSGDGYAVSFVSTADPAPFLELLVVRATCASVTP